jgi:glycosyltransferase involved in cell wall biosynthesis
MPASTELSVLQVAAPGPAGGLESLLLELAGGLNELGHRSALISVLEAGTRDHPVLRQATDRGLEVHRVVVPARAYVQEYQRIREVIRDFRPDVVHTHGYRADLIGGFAAQRAGLPWVSTVHGFTGGDRKNRLYEWIQVRAYRGATAVVAVSRPISERLAAEGVPRDVIHVLPNAWAPKPLLSREEARRRLGLEGSDPVIGWVGRLTREKGADLFLEALALLPHHGWRASIIGDGRERSALAAQAARLGIADQVRWHGLVPDAASFYTAFDAWALTSRTEGTPIALFEAIGARVPVVATRVGGVPDVISATEALLVSSEDPPAIAKALEYLLAGSGGASGRAEAAYRRLTRDFARGPWLEAHVSLYRVASSNRASGTDA